MAKTRASARKITAKAAAPPAPDIVVVIPAYKQPLFLVEAIGSVLDQKTDLKIVMVVVDDGCPMASTRDTAAVFAARFPDRIYYLRQPNGGLSAARNQGIDFALQAWPDLKAIYFLDSDNRIMPGFLDRMFAALETKQAGWAYADFDMFGVPGFYAARGEYSTLLHLAYNYCEAGSLVARAVFDQGVRFDEAMKLGFEDWDFWWQAAERGFRGVFVPSAGFQYRRRGESMLTHSERARPEILAAMRRKHQKMLRISNLLRLEAAEMPRYRLALVERDEIHQLLDPARWRPDGPAADASSFAADFCRSEYAPATYSGFRLLAVAPAAAMKLITRWKLARYLFWLAEDVFKSDYFLSVTLRPSGSREIRVIRRNSRILPEDLSAAAMFFASPKIINEISQDPLPQWVESLLGQAPIPKVTAIEIELPIDDLDGVSGQEEYAAVGRFCALMDDIKSSIKARPALPLDWRHDQRMERGEASARLFADLGLGTVLPHLPRTDRKQIGFLLPIFEFGGVEKVVVNYAETLKDLGFVCHLFITERTSIELSEQADEAFETVNFIGRGGQCALNWGSDSPIDSEKSEQTKDTLGMLATMDVIFNTHCLGMHGLIGELRRLGARTYVGLHLNEVHRSGIPRGNANYALAFEHVYDGFVVISEDLRHWCLGQSVSQEKIHLVRNAPSYPLMRYELDDARSLRSRRLAAPQPLQLLYIGRLDPQKGIDRLEEIYEATAHALEWRVVGRAVVTEEDRPAAALRLAAEPPVLWPEQLTALYRWADVVVLPSRFEGVPLTILEAQRLGCVVIATDVGAVREIVTDHEDGLLIDHRGAESKIAADFVAAIGALNADRAMLAAIAKRAMDRAGALRWHDTMAQFSASLRQSLGVLTP